MPHVVEVRVEQDHLRALIGSQPLKAVAELIWNAVDADAQRVVTEVTESPLGGVAEVRVEDDGHGMTFHEAREEFSHLGGSWKRRSGRSRGQRRFLHGSKGQGRWRAYAIGGRVRWCSIAYDQEHDSQTRVTLEGVRDSLGRFSISDPEQVAQPTGTVVIVDCINEHPSGLLGESAVDLLTAEFATYLEANPVEIVYRGTQLDPAALKRYEESYEIDVSDPEASAAILTIIEWSRKVDRALYLCDEYGTALERRRAGVQAPGFEFTAYLKWRGFRTHENELALADLGMPILRNLVFLAREKLREHFGGRTDEVTKKLIEDWKEEDVYPYKNEPITIVETAEKELFDVVALAAAPTVNRNRDRNSKRLTLSLLKEAINQSPRSLRRILKQVLDLSDERIEELDNLLRRTTLTAIIAAAKDITSRLEFLKGLELLLFDQENNRTLLERSQLHRILAHETWIFGEEFNLMSDDSSLTTVLKSHIGELGRDQLVVDKPVRDERGKLQFVDLVMGRALQLSQKRREHLVVELKRPSVVLGRGEYTQIQGYAAAVVSDPRFDKTCVDWHFVLIGNQWDDFVEFQATQQNRPAGLITDGMGLKVWVKTWGQLLEDNEHRLKYVQRSLEYIPSEDQALEYLRRTHSKYLPDSLKSGQ